MSFTTTTTNAADDDDDDGGVEKRGNFIQQSFIIPHAQIWKLCGVSLFSWCPRWWRARYSKPKSNPLPQPPHHPNAILYLSSTYNERYTFIPISPKHSPTTEIMLPAGTKKRENQKVSATVIDRVEKEEDEQQTVNAASQKQPSDS